MKLLRLFTFFITTLLQYLRVPLLGWGLGDLQGYFSSIPHLANAVLVGLVASVVFTAILIYRIND